MTGTNDVRDSEPTPFEAALTRFDAEVRRREGRRVTLDEIVEVIRADRDAANR
jgi:hypothetical protein